MPLAIFVPWAMSAGCFLVGEGPTWGSRQPGILAAGQCLPAGAVLGRFTSSGKLALLAPGATNGTQAVAGLLFDGTDAREAERSIIAVVAAAEVDASRLTWPDGMTPMQRATAVAELLEMGVVVRG